MIGAGGADDVAGAHLGRHCRSKGLEGAHAALMLLAVEGQVTEDLPHPLPKAAHLHEPGAHSIPQAHRDQQKDQDIVRQVLIDLDHHRVQCRFQGSKHFFPPEKNKRNSRFQPPQKKKAQVPAVDPQFPTLSFYLRDSAAAPPCTFGTHF